MSTAKILQFFRDQEPRFSDEPDEKLINFIGSTQKAFLQDEEFKKSYQDVLRGRMEATKTPEGRQEVITESGLEDLTLREDVAVSAEIALKSGIKGALDVFASVPKSIALGASGLDKLRGKDTPPEEFVTYQLGELLREAAEEKFPIDEQARETWSAKIGQGLGSAAGFLAGGALGKTAGATGTSIALLGSAATSNEFYEDAKRSGASEDTALRAALMGAGVGLTEIVPLNKILNKIPGSQAVGFKKTLLDAAISGAEEIAQENLQSALQNVTAQQLGYDPDRGTFEGFEEATVVGGTTGALLSLLASALGVRYRGRVQPQAEETTTPQTDAAVQEAGPVPVATEPADVITGGRTEEEILATAPELPPELQIRQQELEARRQEVESTRAELLEVATRATSEVSAEAIQEAQDLDLEVEGLESEVSQLQSQAEAEPSAEATLALETKQKELDSKRQQVEARRSELLEGVTRTTSDRVSTLIQEAQDLDLELDALTTEVQQLQTQAEAEPTTEATAALESKQQELETKRQQVQSKEVELVDVAKQASEQNLKEDNPSLLETPTSELETDIKPKTDSIVSLGVVGGPMGPATLLPDGKRLKFNPEELVQSWPGRLIQKFRQVLTDGTTAPSEFVEIKAKAKARRDSFVKLSKRYADNINTLANAKAKADGVSKDDVLAQANQYLLGRKAQMKREDMNLLTDKMIDELKKARNLIDALSTRVLDFGFLEGNLAKSIKQNLGSYLLRSYKVFDPAMDWAKNVPFEVKERAIEYLTREIKRKEGRPDQESLSREEASMIVEEILTKPDQTTEWILGKTNVGGIPVSSFLKRKQIPKEIRDLMGEIRDPLQNIVKSTHRVADIVVAFEAQEAIAELGLEVGLFSKEKTKDKLFKLFEDTDSKLAVKYPSLGGLYASKPVVEAMQEFYGAKGNSHVALKTLFSGLAKATSVGKFSQVILNIQDSFMVNLLGAAMVEFANGRISIMPNLTTKAASGLATNVWRKFKGDQTRATTKTPTTEELEQIASQTGKQFIENWNQYLNDPVLTETLTSQYGALDENIVVKDLIGAWVTEEQVGRLSTLDKLAFRAMPEWVRRKVFGKLGNIYSWPDNAMKVNAFFQEALDYANAYPDRSMRDIFRTAGDIARATTPVYSKVPRGLKQLNLVGVIPTYISFIYEMHRNVFNSIIIAKNEINSSNAKIKAKGAKRMVFSLGVLALSAKGMEGIIDLVRNYFTDSDELDEQGQKDLEWLMAPWDRPQQNGVLNFKAGEEFTYANLSYQVPQAVLTAPFVAAFKGEDGADAFNEGFATLMNTWFGGSVLPSTLGEVYYNKKDGGGEIYNESLPLLERVPSSLEHISKNVFMPGFIRKIDRMQKAWDESENSYGRVYSMGEETMRLFSLRPTTYNIPEASRFRMQQFNRDYSTASRFTSRVKAEKLTPEEAKEQQAKEDELINKVKDDYAKFIQAMLRLGVPKATLRKNERDLFKAESGERRSSLYKDLRSTSAPFLR